MISCKGLFYLGKPLASYKKERSIWNGMKGRCHNPNHADYPKYGEVGIFVCLKWRYSFLKFLQDVGVCPSTEHTLDRIDSTKGYLPSNTRWATRLEQSRNTKKVKPTGGFGCRAEFVQHAVGILGLSPKTIEARLVRGWTPDQILAVGAQPHGTNKYTSNKYK